MGKIASFGFLYRQGRVVEIPYQRMSAIRVAWRYLLAELDPEGTLELGYGGMVVLSADVNVGVGGFLSKMKSFLKSRLQRWFSQSKADKELQKLVKENGIATGWSIGKLFRGRYVNPKSGESFDEKSFAIDIRGADINFVKKVARELAKKFGQHSALLIDHETGKSHLVFP